MNNKKILINVICKHQSDAAFGYQSTVATCYYYYYYNYMHYYHINIKSEQLQQQTK